MQAGLEQIINQAANELRSWGGVAIIGAGGSLAAGFPLTAQLQALLWHALDAEEGLRITLATEHGWTGASAKEMIGDDPFRTRIALEALTRSSSARQLYQSRFARLNAERVTQPSRVHDALAELLHRRIIELVVSFNWDRSYSGQV